MRYVYGGLLCAAMLVGSLGDAEAGTKYFGVKGGVNIADMTGNDAEGLGSRNGFIGGAFFGVDFAEGFGVRIDGLYVQKGAEGPFPTDDGDIHNTVFKLDYIEFPVLFTVGFPAGENFAVNLVAGPTFGFNTTAEAEIEEHGTEEVAGAESFEFGAAFGGGLEYILSSFSIIADVRYAIGATSIVEDVDAKNAGVGVMLGVKFPLGAGAP